MIAENETGYGWQVDKSLRRETIMFKFVFFDKFSHLLAQNISIYHNLALGSFRK